MKKILILGAGEMQVPIIRKVKELGYQSIVCDMDNDAVGKVYADIFLAVSTNDVETIMETATANEIDGILTTSDFPVNVVARVATELDLPSVSIKAAEICTNKLLQRNFMKSKGLNTPRFTTNIHDTEIAFPCVVKPVDSSASRGVAKVNNTAELRKAAITAEKFSRSKSIIIEELLLGKEYSVETLTQNNLTSIIAITEKILIGSENGYFVEDAHVQPASLSINEYNLIVDEVLKAIDAIGLNNCPTHTEVKLYNSKCTIVEIACRLGGDYITSHLTPLSTGVDMLANLVRLSVGEKIVKAIKYNKCAAVQFLNNSNYFSAIKVIKEACPNIIEFQVKEYSGTEIEDSLGRLGHVIIQTETIDELKFIINELNKQ